MSDSTTFRCGLTVGRYCGSATLAPHERQRFVITSGVGVLVNLSEDEYRALRDAMSDALARKWLSDFGSPENDPI